MGKERTLSEWEDYWKDYWNPPKDKVELIKKSFKAEKCLAMGLMPIRGPEGFRKLDYEYAKILPVKDIMDKLEECHINVLGVVIKDTDGACMWDTKKGWNPTGRDILGEFVDAVEDRNIQVMASFTSMNDAYAGHTYPERVSVHGKSGSRKSYDEKGIKIKEKYEIGDISIHDEGEMRVDLPEGVTFEEYKKVIPFLQNKIDLKVGASRGSRGSGYIPTTSFMCPNSEHIDYLVDLAEEVVKNYKISSIFADYIRYDGAYTDLCTCERCRAKFAEKYGKSAKIMRSKEWFDFKEDTIADYARRLNEKVKSINSNCITGWFALTGPKLFTRNRLGQNWTKIGEHLDAVSPMIYPYLMGTRDDGKYWGFIGDISYKFSIINMKLRLHEYNNQAVLTITNSVECNKEEMIRQMKTFDFGLGIALFKYYGTSEEQWSAIKKFAEEEYGLEKLGLHK